jgi:hypothetical protein
MCSIKHDGDRYHIGMCCLPDWLDRRAIEVDLLEHCRGLNRSAMIRDMGIVLGALKTEKTPKVCGKLNSTALSSNDEAPTKDESEEHIDSTGVVEHNNKRSTELQNRIRHRYSTKAHDKHRNCNRRFIKRLRTRVRKKEKRHTYGLGRLSQLEELLQDVEIESFNISHSS